MLCLFQDLVHVVGGGGISLRNGTEKGNTVIGVGLPKRGETQALGKQELEELERGNKGNSR